MEKKFVYSFNEGTKEMKSLLGGKGANLAEMTKIGLPVPFGFTVSTEGCRKYYANQETLEKPIIEEIFKKLQELEQKSKKRFGDVKNPLLLSVRSGSVFSMPGMMDTILNLGLNDESLEGLAKLTNNKRFACDSYRRFIQMFSDVVLEIPKFHFERVLDQVKEKNNFTSDVQLEVNHLEEVIEAYKALVLKYSGKAFPQDPKEQLIMSIEAVFKSWNNDRACIYRDLNNISADLGTAVNVQEMVFGNMGDTSGTGVAFSRNPVTGENVLFGEFLLNAQGEDVVAGIRTPLPISEMKNAMPKVYKEFLKVSKLLEKHYKDMQDLEFTVEKEKLFMLQTRNGKRTAEASVKIAVNMVEEGLIDEKTAVTRVECNQIDTLLHPTFDEDALSKAISIGKGLPASPGAATGKIYFTSKDAAEAVNQGEKVILVRLETSPEDIEGMVVAEGILTSRGGMTSHAAVVARGMGKCCVAGCSDIRVEEELKTVYISGESYKEGDFISIDGATGHVYKGEIPTKNVKLSGDFATIMKWADGFRRLKVRANADTPKDAAIAVEFGAEGIGLCRTEHMFFDEERLPIVRKMIVANDIDEREEALKALLPFQKSDFKGIFKAMGSRPVTVRLLDPPLHEFLPHTLEETELLSKQINVPVEALIEKVAELKEVNPMLGHRGCRLAVTFPEIYRMQTHAIILAAIELKKEENIVVEPEIMIPLVGLISEFRYVRKIVDEAAKEMMELHKCEIEYTVGTMIEVPRAALTAEEIAESAEFFSFGTNDLTQMTFGYSRDDAGKFLREYRTKEILKNDPFEVLDQDGVGTLITMATELGRSVNKNIKLGICGEHGGEPSSIEFCNAIGLDYVSCSPYRVPIARLAAAQAAIKVGEVYELWG